MDSDEMPVRGQVDRGFTIGVARPILSLEGFPAGIVRAGYRLCRRRSPRHRKQDMRVTRDNVRFHSYGEMGN